MPNLKDIKRRIVGVKKTQQITRAMRMVAGAKLRRAQNAITASRPYAEQMHGTLTEVARCQSDAEHPLLRPHASVQRVGFIVITSDRGLCGAFNSNVLRCAQRLIAGRDSDGVEVAITAVGRKASEFFRRRREGPLDGEYLNDGWVTYARAAEIAASISGKYTEGLLDEVVLVYSEFVSTMTQNPREVRLLPFAPISEPSAEAAAAENGAETIPFEVEPNTTSLLATLVPKTVEVTIFRALLENQAGEHAARMAAMESATRNTEDLIESLTVQYNRARQAAITKELVEIVSGAEALQ